MDSHIRHYRKLARMQSKLLTDTEYLENFMLNLYRFNSHGLFTVKSPESEHMAISPTFSKMIGFENVSDILGKKDEEIPNVVSEMADIFYAQDRKVAQTRSSQQMLEIIEYPTGIAMLNVIKEPIINPATNNLLGIHGFTRETFPDSALSTLFLLHRTKYGVNNSLSLADMSDPGLTKHEYMTLFCICLGVQEAKYIVKLIYNLYKDNSFNEQKIKKIFSNLYEKLQCNDHAQLIDLAFSNNIHLQIPKEFLPRGSFNVVSHPLKIFTYDDMDAQD